MNEDPHRIMADAAGAAGQFQQKHFTASPAPLQSNITAADARRLIDTTACEFLRLILPDRGYYAATIRRARTGRFENVFAGSIEELWNLIKQADEAGDTVYYACASRSVAQAETTSQARREQRGEVKWI